MLLPLLHRSTQMAVLKKLIRRKSRELRRRRQRAQRRLEMMRLIRKELLLLMQRSLDLRQRDAEEERREQARRAVGGLLLMYKRSLGKWTRALSSQARLIRLQEQIKRRLDRRLRLLRKRLRKHRKPQKLLDRCFEKLGKAVKKWQREPKYRQYIEGQERIWEAEAEEVRKYLSDIRGRSPKQRKSRRRPKLILDLSSFWTTEVLPKMKNIHKAADSPSKAIIPERKVYTVPKQPRRPRDTPSSSESIYINLDYLAGHQGPKKRRKYTRKHKEKDPLEPMLRELKHLYDELVTPKIQSNIKLQKKPANVNLYEELEKAINNTNSQSMFTFRNSKMNQRKQVTFNLNRLVNIGSAMKAEILESRVISAKRAKKYKTYAIPKFNFKLPTTIMGKGPLRIKHFKKPKYKFTEQIIRGESMRILGKSPLRFNKKPKKYKFVDEIIWEELRTHPEHNRPRSSLKSQDQRESSDPLIRHHRLKHKRKLKKGLPSSQFSDDGTYGRMKKQKKHNDGYETSLSNLTNAQTSYVSLSESVQKIIVKKPNRKSNQGAPIIRDSIESSYQNLKGKGKLLRASQSDNNQSRKSNSFSTRISVSEPLVPGKREHQRINRIDQGDDKKSYQSGDRDMNKTRNRFMGTYKRPGLMNRPIKIIMKKHQSDDQIDNESGYGEDDKESYQTGYQDMNKTRNRLMKTNKQAALMKSNKTPGLIKSKKTRSFSETDQAPGLVKIDPTSGITNTDPSPGDMKTDKQFSIQIADQDPSRPPAVEEANQKLITNELPPPGVDKLPDNRLITRLDNDIANVPRLGSVVKADSFIQSYAYSQEATDSPYDSASKGLYSPKSIFDLNDMVTPPKYRQVQQLLKDVIGTNEILEQSPDVGELMKLVGKHYMWGHLNDLHTELMGGGINKQEVKRVLTARYMDYLGTINSAMIKSVRQSESKKEKENFWKQHRMSTRLIPFGIKGLPKVKSERHSFDGPVVDSVMYRKLMEQEQIAEQLQQKEFDERTRRLIPTFSNTALSSSSTNTLWDVASQEEQDLRDIEERYSLTNLKSLRNELKVRFQFIERRRKNSKVRPRFKTEEELEAKSLSSLHQEPPPPPKETLRKSSEKLKKQDLRPIEQLYYDPRKTSRQKKVHLYLQNPVGQQEEDFEKASKELRGPKVSTNWNEASVLEKCPKCGVKVSVPARVSPSPRASNAILGSGSIEACAKSELVVNTIADICTRCGFVHDLAKPCSHLAEDPRKTAILRLIKAVQAVRKRQCPANCSCHQFFKRQAMDVRSCSSRQVKWSREFGDVEHQISQQAEANETFGLSAK